MQHAPLRAPAHRAPDADAVIAPYDAAAEAADLAACRQLMRGGSRSFFAASLLLPPGVRRSACALYAFCRLADDEVDIAAARDGDAAAAVARLRSRLDVVYGHHRPPHAADRALAAVVRRHAVPRSLLDALIEGFAWDAAGRRYETYDDLCDYAARVAGTVGAMMSLLMGVRAPDAVARACDLGVAMQLSNIARDVGEDAAMGRLYLPRAWMREAGLDPEAWLRRPHHGPALAAVVERLLAEADVLYARVDAGVARLPVSCRPGINAARRLYAEIGHEVRRRGHDALASRAVVPGRRKARLLVGAVVRLWPAEVAAATPALPATRGLVASVQLHDAARGVAMPPTPRSRVHGVFDLFERLERADRRPDAARRFGAA